jgi:S1-C subfamily serine protease
MVARGDDKPAAGGGAWIGVSTRAQSPTQQMGRTTSPGGLKVIDVTPGGPADEAGIETGDVLMKIDSHALKVPDDLTAAVLFMDPGRAVEVVLDRGGRTIMTFSMKPGLVGSNVPTGADTGAASNAGAVAGANAASAPNAAHDTTASTGAAGGAAAGAAAAGAVVGAGASGDGGAGAGAAATGAGAVVGAGAADAGAAGAGTAGAGGAGAEDAGAGIGAAAVIGTAAVVGAVAGGSPADSAQAASSSSDSTSVPVPPPATSDSSATAAPSPSPATFLQSNGAAGLGVRCENLSIDLAKAIGSKPGQGVLVLAVTSGSPADKSGIRPGDVITFIGEKPVPDVDHLDQLIGGATSPLTIVTWRKGTTRVVSAEFAAAPPPEDVEALRSEVKSLQDEIRKLREELAKTKGSSGTH